MSNLIYIIYEVDEHHSYDSIVVKHLDTNKKRCSKIFIEMVKQWKTGSSYWHLILTSYDPKDSMPKSDCDLFHNLNKNIVDVEDCCSAVSPTEILSEIFKNFDNE
jgi:hypothetical protein